MLASINKHYDNDNGCGVKSIIMMVMHKDLDFKELYYVYFLWLCLAGDDF